MEVYSLVGCTIKKGSPGVTVCNSSICRTNMKKKNEFHQSGSNVAFVRSDVIVLGVTSLISGPIEMLNRFVKRVQKGSDKISMNSDTESEKFSRRNVLQSVMNSFVSVTAAILIAARPEKGSKEEKSYELCLSKCLYKCTVPRAGPARERSECRVECKDECATTPAQL
mmetsp:Transcript_9508/g.17160  ORF Transcript_9508/g.17160 Transcript_9508/m.17160 type:complete len:168 (-) Transcript_9508:613-1116(-)